MTSSIPLFTFQIIISYSQSKDNLNTSLLNREPCVPACQLGLPANVLACQRGLLVNVPAYQQAKGVATSHVYVGTGHKCANVPIAYQCFIRRANVPKRMPTFQAFLLRNAKGNFSTLLLYKKFYIILDIIVVHIICICNVHKHCIILHFYTSCDIKEKYVNLFFFIIFFLFCSLVRNENLKRPGSYTLE